MTTETATGLVGTDIVTGYGTTEIVHGVSIESREGVTCVFGPNGSGKSTLMKALSGKLPAWEGTVTHNGEDITDQPISDVYQRGVVQVPQDGGLFPSLTVRENLKLGGIYIDEDQLPDRIDGVYDWFPALAEKQEVRARELSGGQQMMLSLGRAMIANPSVYLLDEPSAGLAPSLVDDVFEIVRDLVAEGAHVILIEQNIRSALRVADYVRYLPKGRRSSKGSLPISKAEKIFLRHISVFNSSPNMISDICHQGLKPSHGGSNRSYNNHNNYTF
jgi:branched-chain amino acid transport system ATP-binding protein